MLNASLSPFDGTDDRAAVRIRLLVDATCDAIPNAPMDLTIRDLSTTGVLFETDADLESPSVIKLHLPVVGICEAKLVWSGGRYRGAEFVTPLTRSSVQAVHDLSKVVWPAFSPGPVAGIDDRNMIEAMPAAKPDEVEVFDTGLPPNRKIQFVVGLAISLWSGLALGAHMLAA